MLPIMVHRDASKRTARHEADTRAAWIQRNWISRLPFVCFFLPLLLPIVHAPAQNAGPASLPTTQPIPRQSLETMYRTELGNLYKPADAPKIHQAHLLIERYFASPSERREIVRSLESVGLDPNILGRLTRLRMTWPALAPGVYYINEKVGPHDVRYFLGVPKGYDRAKPWPMVIKLPTADAFVTDPRPDPIQVNDIYSTWMTSELTLHPDAIVIMPLLNLDELWGPSYTGMNSVIQPMHHAAGRVNIDPARVYMLGHGMSAHATWNLALHYTTYFASFASLAGGAGADWQRTRLLNLRNVLPVVWHDSDDQVIRVESSRQIMQILRTQRIDAEYLETRMVGHIPTDEIVTGRYAKMRSRTRTLYPLQLTIQSSRPDTMFNRIDWAQVYQPLNTSNEKRLNLSRGTGHMIVYPTSHTLQATLANNAITVTTGNVASMRFYVNDQMIDFNRAVSVVLNRRPRFEAILKPNIEEMLKDQLFLGRGWRYYTAIIDLDFTVANRAGGIPATQP